MTDKLQAMITSIRELAGKATPSEWIDDENCSRIVRLRDYECVAIIPEPKGFSYEHTNEVNVEATCRYIVAVQPQAITTILDTLEHLNRQVEWLAERMKCDNTFTPEQEAACIAENGPCAKCLRDAARRNTI